MLRFAFAGVADGVLGVGPRTRLAQLCTCAGGAPLRHQRAPRLPADAGGMRCGHDAAVRQYLATDEQPALPEQNDQEERPALLQLDQERVGTSSGREFIEPVASRR